MGHVPHMRENVLHVEPEGQRPIGRGRNSWERNISVDFDKTGPHLSGSGQGYLVGSCKQCHEPSVCIMYGIFHGW